MKFKISLLTVLVLFISNISSGQNPGLYIPRNVQKALNNRTRSLDGRPGINYWQNGANYNIDIEFDPKVRLVKGKERIIYFNNSPDTLNEITVHLFPNFFKKGNPRDFAINYEDESDGVVIEKISYNGTKMDIGLNSKFIENRGTNLKLKLTSPLLPKSNTEIAIDWNYILNKGSNVRTGTID